MSTSIITTPATKWRRRFRPFVPAIFRDTYDLVWRTRWAKMSALAQARYLCTATSHRLIGLPRAVRVTPRESQPVWLRPFSSDQDVARTLWMEGEYELVRHHVPEARRIVDLGANIGISVRLWQQWYPGAQILAVEPDPDNYRLAQYNCNRGKRHNTKLVNAAVSDQAGSLHLSRTALQPWAYSTQVEATPETIEVAAIDMPTLLAPLGGQPIDVLKVDIEGGEAALFAACTSWIQQVKALVIETHEPYSLERLAEDLAAGGSSLKLVARQSHGPENEVGLLIADPSNQCCRTNAK